MDEDICKSKEVETYIEPYMNQIRVGMMRINEKKSIIELRIYEGASNDWIPYFIKTLQEHYTRVFSYNITKGDAPEETQEEKAFKEELLKEII